MDLQTLVDKESSIDSQTLHVELIDALINDRVGYHTLGSVTNFASLVEKYLLRNHPLHHAQRHNKTPEKISPMMKASIRHFGRFIQDQMPHFFKKYKAYETVLKHTSLDEEQKEHYLDVLNHFSADLSYLHHLAGETAMLSYYEVKPEKGFSAKKKLRLIDKWFRNKVTAAFSILDLDPLTAAYAFDSAAKAARNGFNITFDRDYVRGGDWSEFRKEGNLYWADRAFMASSQTAHLFNQYEEQLTDGEEDEVRISLPILESTIAHSYRRVGDAAKVLYVLHDTEYVQDIAYVSYGEFLETATPYLKTEEQQKIYERVEKDVHALSCSDAKQRLLERPSLLTLTPF